MLLFLLGAQMMTFGVEAATQDGAPPSAPPPIVLAVVGTPMTNLQADVAHHVAAETGYPVHILERSVALTDSPQSQALAVAGQMGSHALFAVALVNVSGKSSPLRSAFFTSDRVALVDVGWLRRSLPQGMQKSAQTLKLRLRKETMRAVGKLIGLPDCPYPRCCLLLCGTYEELDAKGADFCPPCQALAEHALDAVRASAEQDR